MVKEIDVKDSHPVPQTEWVWSECAGVQMLLDEGVINEIVMGQGTLICASKGIQDDFVATWKIFM